MHGKLPCLIFSAVFFLFTNKSFSQTPGMIFDPATGGGAAVLDPNGDGYTSATTAGFISDDQSESELPFTAFNFLTVEPTSDLGPGPDCGFTDFVDEGDEDPAQYYFDASNNWLFRLRMGKALTNSKSYSILIDTDEKFGSSGANADPNALPGNPGFEIEIVLATNFGVYVYNVDGKNSTISPVLMRTYAIHTNYQKSIALTTNCSDPDYFYDFFVPFGHLTTDFGITTSTPLRMAIIDNMAAGASSIGQPSSMSDLGGVDDASCGNNYESCFGDVLDIYPPTCVTCPPQPDRSACPEINSPIQNGATSVSGTSSEANGTTIKIFKNGTQIGTTTVTAGTYTLTGISPALVSNDIIEASATAPGKSESVKNCDATTVNQICTAAITSVTVCNANKAIQGLGISGAVINIYSGSSSTPLSPSAGYNFSGGLVTAGTLPSTLSPTTDNWLWKCVGSGQTNSCTAGGGPCIADGAYRITQQLSGQCESDPVWICMGGVAATATPTITTTPILISTTSVSGSVPAPDNVAGVQIILYSNTTQIATGTTIAGGAWTINGLSLTARACESLTAKAIASSKCLSAASTAKTILATSAAPVITGTYCTSTTITSVTGTSTEAAGTVIQVYENGVAEGATTTVASNGSWTANSGISIAPGNTITARATAACGTQSGASNSVVVWNKTTNAVAITSSPITEGDASVSGTGTNGDVITLYVDGTQVGGTTTVVGGMWTIAGLGVYDLYTDGIVTATASSAGKCESNPSNNVTVICIQPLTNLTIDPIDTTVCTGSVVANVRVMGSQVGVIYQLFNGATPTGSSKLGTGGTITLNSGTLSASTTLTVKAIKIPVGSCTATLTDNVPVTVNAVPTLTLTTGVSTNPICASNSTNITVANSQVGFSYQLRNDAGDVNVGSSVAGTGGTINLPTGNISSTTTYNVYATGVSPSNCSGELSTLQTVTVNPGPVLTLAVGTSSNPICSGSSTNITVALSQAGFSYQLRNDADDSNVGSAVAGTGGTINLPTGSLTSTTTFNVFASGAGCTGELTTTITITVNPLPTPTFTASPTPVCVNATGNVYATQGGMSSYVWTVSGGTITSGGTASDNTATVTWTSSGTQSITVTYTDGNGCAAASPILQTVTVNSLPTPSFTSGANSVCQNSTGNVYTTQAGMTNYIWSISGGTITSGGTATDNSATVTWTTAGTQSISVNYTDGSGCTASSATTQTVTVTALPSAPAGSSPQTFCDAGTVSNLSATGSNIQWYSASSGGTPLAGATSLVNGNTYYASQTVSGCESSSRLPVLVVINNSTTSTINATACDTYTLNASTYTLSGTYTQTIPNSVSCDSVITLNLTIKNSTTSTINATACDTYTLNATTYTTSGTYSQTIPNAVGCDSTITLNLTIKNSTSSTLNVTACDSYTLNASTYTASGTYSQTIPNSVGCDSAITLNLTIKNSSSSTINATACDTYTLNASTYTTSGTYSQTIANAVGCDSVITLNLTIKNSSSSTMNATACDTYTLNATTYTASGTYTQIIANAIGCDSTITLNLTIKNSTSSTLNVTACDTYTLNATTYTTSGTYSQTIPNSVGCDSVITLNLTINNSSASTVNATSCNSYTLNASTYTASGTYTQTIPNAVGCDSVITLNLTIVPGQTAFAGNDQNLTCGTTTTTITATAPTSGSGAWTVIAGSGTVTSPSNANSGVTGLSSGVNTFRWTITNLPCSNTFDDVNVNVICGNLPPVAQNDTVIIPEDSPATSVNVQSNDSDPNLDPLTTSIVTSPANGIALLNGNNIDYIPNPNYFGNDTIVYAVCDNGSPSLCDTAIVIITVTPVNDPPVVNDTSVVTVEDSAITVCLPITDIDGSTFTATLCGVANGTASVTVTGNQACVLYTPNANFNGLDSVCIVVCDNGTPSLCDTAHIYITVTPKNDKPVVPDSSVTTPENTPITVCLPITDVDTGSTFTGNLCGVTNGTATVSVSGNQICATYTPTPAFNGTATVCVVVCDNGTPSLCDTATITITVTPVNDKPIAQNDSLTINEDAGTTSINVQANDSDPDGNPLTTSIVISSSNGTAVLNGNNIDYTPNPNFNGNDTIVYAVCDNGTPALCDTAIVIIKVSPVNDAPDAVTDFASTNEGTPVGIDVQANDSDVDGDPLITSVIVSASNGTVTILNNDSLSYNPNTNFTGVDTIIYQICDNGIPPLCDADTVFINVININDAPIALDDYTTTDPLVPDTVNVLVNDFDPDGDPLTVTIVSQPDSGVATLFGNQIIYVTNATFINGIDTIIYAVCDNGSPQLCDTAMVIVYVPKTSLPPMARDDYATTPEDQNVVVNVLFNDSDPNIPGDTLTVTILNGPQNGTAFVTANNQVSYTPNLNYNGLDSLVYVVCDTTPFCDTAVVYINVTPVNDAPIAVVDSATTNVNTSVTVDVQANDSDVDGNPLITSVIVPPMNGTVIVLNNDSVIYTPNLNYFGPDYFVYQICDNGVPTLCDADTVFINVLPNNSPPVAVTDVVSVNEDSSININVQNNDSDPNGDPLTTSIVSGPYNGTANVLNGDSISYTPNPNYNGADTIIYQICDNGVPQLCDVDTVFINVIPVNDGPVVNDTSVVTAEDSTITVCLPIIDVDAGSTFSASLCGVANGTASVTVTGNQVCVTYTPNLNFNGLDSVCVVVCDNGAPAPLCDTAHIYITVTPKNDPPAVNDTTVVTTEDSTITVCLPISDADTGSTFSASLCGVANGTASVTVTGNQVCVTYTPNLNFNGLDSVCVVVCDNGTPSLCDTAHIYITVTPKNDPPVVNDTTVVTGEGNPTIVCIPISDPDTGQTFSVSNCGNPVNGTYTATVSANQVCVTYTPNPNFNGLDSLCIVICDNGNPSLCDTSHINITVTPGNDPPVVTDTSATVPEDSVITVCTTIFDVDTGSTFTASLCGVANGTVSVSVTGNQLCVTYTPNLNFNGLDSVCVIVCDNGTPSLCDTGYIVITVVPRNDPPVVNDTSATIANDSSLLICVPIFDIDTGQTFSATLCGVNNGTAVAGTSGNLLCVSYTPDSTFIGMDTVCVIVCDDGTPSLCDTAWVIITVTDDTTPPPPPPPPPTDSTFVIPGGFSPNGDGVNDFFEIVGIERYPDNHIIIFNRWGNQVYETQPYENKWDGTYQGNMSVGNQLPAGTYYYVLDLGNGTEVIKRYVYLSR